MYSPLSSKFEPFLRSSGPRVLSVDLYYKGNLIRENMAVAAGQITSDVTSDCRRQGQVDIVITGDSDNEIDTVLNAVFDSEVIVKSGLQYSNGAQELIPQGVFMIWNASIDYEQGDVVSLEIYDRSKYLSQTNLIKMYDASGKTATVAIQELVTMALPVNQTVNFSASLPVIVLPGGTTYDGTNLEAILDLAEMLGAQFYFDVNGNAICSPKAFIDPSTPLSAAVYSADIGEDGNITALGRTIGREGVNNGIGVYGGVSDANTSQAYAEVYDDNPSSKTYWNGPFGKAFRRIDRPELLTNADCLSAARAELNKSIGAAKHSTFQILPNPALEPGDIISVEFPDSSTELHLIDSIDYDLDEQSMQITTRGQNG